MPHRLPESADRRVAEIWSTVAVTRVSHLSRLLPSGVHVAEGRKRLEALSIRQAIEKVLAGQLRIPAFQRGFVWDADRVAYLMDSIYKGYPFGSLILWRTKTPLRTERDLGPFSLPDGQDDYPTDYVLDGQQRLTSIFGVFQTELISKDGADSSWSQIYFDMNAGDDLQESQFVYVEPKDFDAGRYFPVGTFFDVVGYRKATQALTQDQILVIDQVQSVFKESTIPVQLIETDDRAKVAIVFERVNRLGVELDTLQLLSAWTWSEEFDLQERFQDLAAELQPFGFGAVGEDTNLLLRACAAVVAGDVSSSTLLKLNGSEVRQRFEEIENGLRGAIDFVRKAFHVQKLGNLPMPAMLVPLAVFFAVPNGVDLKVSNDQHTELVTWFWRSCFSRRFIGDVLRRLNVDIAEARKLRTTGTSDLASIANSINADWFVENKFAFSSVNTKTFILMLASNQPRSFISGGPVDLGKALQTYNRAEFHHVFPRAYLAAKGVSAEAAGSLANFAMINAADNRSLSSAAPSVYRAKMPTTPAALETVLDSALCPAVMFSDDFEGFLAQRSGRLRALARELAAMPSEIAPQDVGGVAAVVAEAQPVDQPTSFAAEPTLTEPIQPNLDI